MPLSNSNLETYAYDLYGDTLNDVKYYETIEVKDAKVELFSLLVKL